MDQNPILATMARCRRVHAFLELAGVHKVFVRFATRVQAGVCEACV